MFYGPEELNFFKKIIDVSLDIGTLEDGMIPLRKEQPEGRGANVNDWTWFILLAYEAYLCDGDTDFLRKHLRKLRLIYNFAEKNFFSEYPSKINYPWNPDRGYSYTGYLDFVFRDGKVMLSSVLWYQATMAMAEVMKATGNPNDESEFRKKARLLKDSINKELWDEELGYYYDYIKKDGNVRKEYESAGLMLAIESGIADRRKAEKIVDYMNRFDRAEHHSIVPGKHIAPVLPYDQIRSAGTFARFNSVHLYEGVHIIAVRNDLNQHEEATYQFRRFIDGILKYGGARQHYTPSGLGVGEGDALGAFSEGGSWTYLAFYRGMLGIERTSENLKIGSFLPESLSGTSVDILYLGKKFTINFMDLTEKRKKVYRIHGDHDLPLLVRGLETDQSYRIFEKNISSGRERSSIRESSGNGELNVSLALSGEHEIIIEKIEK